MRKLWADRRSYKKRLPLSAAIMLAFCFTFVFYGPLEMVAFSADSLVFSWRDVVLPLAGVAMAAFAAGALLLALLRGKIFNCGVSIVFSLTVAGWLQAALMNGQLGTLTGDQLPWNDMAWSMIGNLFVWLALLAIVLLVMHLRKQLWKQVMCFGAVLLVVMQLAPAVGIFAGMYDSQSEMADSFLSQKGMYEFSSKDNVFVFVLDRLDYDYIQKALQEEPTMLDGLDGFTGYENAVSVFARTRPALVQLLTGYSETAYEVSTRTFYQQAWNNGPTNLLQELEKRDYSVSMYTKLNYLFSDLTDAKSVDNLGNGKGDMRTGLVVRKLLNLSAYRYAPMALKKYFWADTNYYNADVYAYGAYQFDDAGYAIGLAQGTARLEKNSFKLYHFYGPHAPYTMNADGTASEDKTTVTAQTRGSFANLIRIFDRMKELGIYEGATIIITGDHGNPISDRKPIQKATRIGLFYKPSGSAGTPLVMSDAPVSTDNIAPTLLKAIGADYSGTALDEVEVDTVRYTYKSVIGENTGREVGFYTYAVTGDAADFKNWQIIDYADTEYSFY